MKKYAEAKSEWFIEGNERLKNDPSAAPPQIEGKAYPIINEFFDTNRSKEQVWLLSSILRSAILLTNNKEKFTRMSAL